MTHAAPHTIPTVPTSQPAGRDGQPSDIANDPYHPDHQRGGETENKVSLRGLAEKIRSRTPSNILESRTRYKEGIRDGRDGVVFTPPLPFQVGKVGTVGTVCEINDLAGKTGRDGGRDSRDDAGLRVAQDASCPDRDPADDLPHPLSEDDYEAAPVLDAALTVPTSSDPWRDGIRHLEQMPPPAGFTAAAWMRVKRGCVVLLRSHGPDLRQLGWSAEDAFGLHRSVPFHCVHAWGLGPLLGDGEIAEVSATGGVIRRRDGSRQSYTRRPMPDAVPIWAVEHADIGSRRSPTGRTDAPHQEP